MAIDYAHSTMLFSESWMLLGGGLWVAIAIPRESQTCSIELRSINLAGQPFGKYLHIPENHQPDKLYMAVHCHSLKLNKGLLHT